jgi:aldehyde:ferredoxin oxidoreductase
MDGMYGRFLIVDLSSRNHMIKALDKSVYRDYLGGKGLGSYLLYKYNPPKIDPLDPKNCLIFATGPVCGTTVWGSCRYGVFTKSPLTGLYAESYSGGKVPEAIDATGFDAILIQGDAAQPTILVVTDDGVQFQDAGDLWGAETYATEDSVMEAYTKSKKFKQRGAVVIGPAAEKQVRFAVIENDYWRSAGRAGVGTVMGAKHLKAIVFMGNAKRAAREPSGVKAFSKKIAGIGKDNPGVKAYKSMGTPMMVKLLNAAGAFPTRYWSEGYCKHWEKISADALHTSCDVKSHACLKCFMACGRLTMIKNGRHAGLKLEGPEYETIYAFGGLCMIDSIEEIVYLNDVCDRLGMDTITAGNLCAFAMEASKRGKITETIAYGDADATAVLLQQIAHRKGIGDILAKGIIHAAKKWGLEDVAVHVKGMEPAGYDPRVLKGMGLAYATSDRGACHLRATFYKPELAGMIPPEQIEEKAALFVDFEDRLTLFDALVLCRFYRDLYPWEELEEMIRVTTGIEEGQAGLKRIANNISNIVRKFNFREGMTAANDRLPEQLHRKLNDSGKVIEKQELERLVADYYALRGWDAKGRVVG